ncbi:hypothetical protein ABFT80_05480 [Mesorhizobium sp. SB112]|uniref:hypothetical protein n=1 Tax=Mesorhizobium sp. SB112 TaxID=3151853 RepID=UPI003264191C
MRQTVLWLSCVFALTVTGMFGSLMLATPHAFAASQENAEHISDRFGFEESYLTNVDGLIAELRKFPGMFSGRENKDTEELRVRLTRERLVGMQSEILGTARSFIAENLSDEEVEHLLSNMGADGRIDDAKATETKDQVVKLYRDAIFNAIIASAVPVQEQADKMKKSGEAAQ